MSYSFSVQAATKAEAKAAVEAEFDKVVKFQPVHAQDKPAVLANAGAVIDLLVDDDTMDISISCNGYVGWGDSADPATVPLWSASVSASAGYVKRVALEVAPAAADDAPVADPAPAEAAA